MSSTFLLTSRQAKTCPSLLLQKRPTSLPLTKLICYLFAIWLLRKWLSITWQCIKSLLMPVLATHAFLKSVTEFSPNPRSARIRREGSLQRSTICIQDLSKLLGKNLAVHTSCSMLLPSVLTSAMSPISPHSQFNCCRSNQLITLIIVMAKFMCRLKMTHILRQA